MDLEDVQTAALRSTIDDEYARAGAVSRWWRQPHFVKREDCLVHGLQSPCRRPSVLCPPTACQRPLSRATGEEDPKVLVTTSRDPSSRLTAFAKELKLVFPNAQRINRGGQARMPPESQHRVSDSQRRLCFLRTTLGVR